MTTPDLPFLQSDRIIFKLFACEEHLKNIKNIKSQHGDLLSKDARVRAEMEIDSLISQMIGTIDSLLLRIIDRFQLTGIQSDRIEIPTIISGLSAQSDGIELAKTLQDANLQGGSYRRFKDLRNYSLSGSLLSAEASLDVIPYFEQTLVQLKEFIKNIITNEPKLQTKESQK
ncbi:MAG: hypothetical protein QOK61_08220 [Nitrososphaeraceae archaeon]|nr:hypothetical protein [Nitrososphaeraceae archaeon]